MVFKDSKIRGGEKAVPQKGAQKTPQNGLPKNTSKWSPKPPKKKDAQNQELLALREIRVVRNLSTVGGKPRVVASIPTQWPCGGN